MKAPVLVDLRNIYRPEEIEKHGFSYTGVGRGSPIIGAVAEAAE